MEILVTELQESDLGRTSPISGWEPTRQLIKEIPVGTAVDLHRKFDGRWSSGFEVVGIAPHGYLVRRLSDRMLMPVAIRPSELRPTQNA